MPSLPRPTTRTPQTTTTHSLAGAPTAGVVSAGPTRMRPYQPNTQPRLILSTEGHSGCGKTRFALSAPRPIGYCSLDRGFEDATDSSLDMAGVDIGDFSLDAILSREDDEIMAVAGVIWEDFCRDWANMLGQLTYSQARAGSPYRTVVGDTGTELWQLIRLARFGRVAKIAPIQYPDINSEFRAKIIKPAYQSGCNVIWTHKLKEERINSKAKNSKGQDIEIGIPTGKWVLDGFKEFRGGENSYAAPTTIRQVRDLTKPIPDRYGIDVLKCAPNPELDGMLLEGYDFRMFALSVYPHSDWDYWE